MMFLPDQVKRTALQYKSMGKAMWDHAVVLHMYMCAYSAVGMVVHSMDTMGSASVKK